jgi:octaheme c-type cytochrome (tetrathionate reductase family)
MLRQLAPILFVFGVLVWPTAGAAAADHKDMISGPFKSGPEVSETCLGCHEQQFKDFMKTVHWTWQEKQQVPGKGELSIGKINLLNNFCIALPANWPRCTSCHAGYGWQDASFNFDDPKNVDCLVCHDTTGTYAKSPAGGGNPDPKVDLVKVAQNVGKPTRQNCGTCHFFGGGGDHVKHGDLDSSLLKPSRSVDVHMADPAPSMTCQDCHKTKDHVIPGESMAVSMGKGARVMCTDCHGETPHKIPTYNKHTKRVACETCHVPVFAKGLPTKVWWDWSKAGQDRPAAKDKHGLETYVKIKGEFRWEKDIRPTYLWYNGETARYLMGDTIDPSKPVPLNKPLGDRKDPNARIMPFKIMRGKQPYDKELKTMAVPHLFGGYWKHFDWNRAIADGHQAAGLPYSGQYDFVETVMYWKVNHMVAPKQAAFRCTACHREKGGILNWKALGYARDPAPLPTK